MGLGSVQLVSLKEARELALKYRAVARSGGDPIAARKTEAETQITFRNAANETHKEWAPTQKNQKAAAQWLSDFENHLFGQIGDIAMRELTTADLVRALKPVWLSKPETSRRMLQRSGKIWRWAKSHGYQVREDPTAGVKEGLPPQRESRSHHRSIPFTEIGPFLRAMRNSTASPVTKIACELIVLTAVRMQELTAARWDEVDFDLATWTIPASRMKAGSEHVVPLSDRSLELLREARQFKFKENLIFPGRLRHKPMSNAAIGKLMKQLGRTEVPHGFRSTFRTWAAEETHHAHDICERALAHTIKNKVEAAYNRGALLKKRRVLMDDWAGFVMEQSR